MCPFCRFFYTQPAIFKLARGWLRLDSTKSVDPFDQECLLVPFCPIESAEVFRKRLIYNAVTSCGHKRDSSCAPDGARWRIAYGGDGSLSRPDRCQTLSAINLNRCEARDACMSLDFFIIFFLVRARLDQKSSDLIKRRRRAWHFYDGRRELTADLAHHQNPLNRKIGAFIFTIVSVDKWHNYIKRM